MNAMIEKIKCMERKFRVKLFSAHSPVMNTGMIKAGGITNMVYRAI
jgi:hypothetical protein